MGKLPEIPNIRSVQHSYARVVAEAKVELSVSNVYRVDASNSALQEYVGETARGRTDVERDPPRDIELKGVEGALELDPAPTYVARCGPLLENGVCCYLAPGLETWVPSYGDFAGQDHRLCALATLGCPTLDEQRVKPQLAPRGVVLGTECCMRCLFSRPRGRVGGRGDGTSSPLVMPASRTHLDAL
jgi:hypothetical protein